MQYVPENGRTTRPSMDPIIPTYPDHHGPFTRQKSNRQDNNVDDDVVWHDSIHIYVIHESVHLATPRKTIAHI